MNASGYTYLLLLPPPGKAYPYTSVVSGRPYVAATQYTMVSVPNFDAAVLTANGWLTVPPGVQIATADYAGVVQPDGTTIPVTAEGVISSAGGGGGGNTFTAVAATALAAGTAVALNSSEEVQQTWGPAPQIPGTGQFFEGLDVTSLATLMLSDSAFVAFATGISEALLGAQPGSITDGVVTPGTVDTSSPSQNFITWGPNNGFVSGIALSESSFILVYGDPSNSYNASVVAGSITDGVIEYGSPVQIEAVGIGSYFPSVALIGSAFVITLNDGNGAIVAVAGTASGNAVTLGELITISASGTAPFIIATPSGPLVALYNDGNNSNLLTTLGLTLSVRTLSPGPPAVVDADNNQESQGFLLGMGENGFIIVAILAPLPALYVGTVSGTSLNLGAAFTDNPGIYGGSSSIPNIVGLDATEFAVSSGTNTPTLSGNGSVATFTANFSARTVAMKAQTFIPPTDSGVTIGFGTMAGLDEDSFILANTEFAIIQGYAAGLSLPIAHQSLTGYWLYTLDSGHALATLTDANLNAYARVINANPVSASGPIGFVSSSYNEGDTATVQTGGVCPGFSGLSPGSKYFCNGDGTVVAANTGQPAGVATTDSTLLIQ
jgi:hypothetical protein